MDPDDAADGGPPERLSGLPGMDLVRRALEEARGAARTQGKDVGRGRRLPPTRRVAGANSRRRWSGPGPDGRDPQPLGNVARDVAKKRGWSSSGCPARTSAATGNGPRETTSGFCTTATSLSN